MYESFVHRFSASSPSFTALPDGDNITSIKRHSTSTTSPSLLSVVLPTKRNVRFPVISFILLCSLFLVISIELFLQFILPTAYSRTQYLNNVSLSSTTSPTPVCYPEQLPGYWDDQLWRTYNDNCTFTNYIGVLVGDTINPVSLTLKDLDFLRDRTMLLFGDSYERYTVEFLCNIRKDSAVRFHWENETESLPDINPLIDELDITFWEQKYKQLHNNWDTHFYGIEICKIGALNFTVISMMQMGVMKLPTWITPPSPSTIWKEAVIPFLDPNNTRLPDMVFIQSGMWDLSAKPTSEQIHKHYANSFEQELIKPIQETYLKYEKRSAPIIIRTMPEVPDAHDSVRNDIVHELNPVIINLSQQYNYRLIDLDRMVIGKQKWIFDNHHYRPHIMFNMMNILLNFMNTTQHHNIQLKPISKSKRKI